MWNRVVMLLASLVAVVCASIGQQALFGAQSETARTGVTLDVREVAPYEGVPRLRLELFNGSDRELWVNKRMSWNSESMLEEAREITLDVRDKEGRVLPYTCKSHNGAAGPRDYVVLFPTSFVGRLLRLDCVSLKRGARYTVVVRYLDRTHDVKPMGGYPRLDWEVVSQPIEIRVP